MGEPKLSDKDPAARSAAVSKNETALTRSIADAVKAAGLKPLKPEHVRAILEHELLQKAVALGEDGKDASARGVAVQKSDQHALTTIAVFSGLFKHFASAATAAGMKPSPLVAEAVKVLGKLVEKHRRTA